MSNSTTTKIFIPHIGWQTYPLIVIIAIWKKELSVVYSVRTIKKPLCEGAYEEQNYVFCCRICYGIAGGRFC